MAITRADFPLPDVDEPLVAPFFAAAARGELMIPRCEACGKFVWYPAASCPRCEAPAPVWTAVSGRATLFSWAVVHRPFLPGVRGDGAVRHGPRCAGRRPGRARPATYLVDAEAVGVAGGTTRRGHVPVVDVPDGAGPRGDRADVPSHAVRQRRRRVEPYSGGVHAKANVVEAEPGVDQ